MSTPILYGHPLSPYVRKARLCLIFSGIAFTLEPITPHADIAEFQAASPLGKIPGFCDGELSFSDSTVIAHYVNRFLAEDALIPADPAGYVGALWYEEYTDNVLVPCIGGHLFAEVVFAGRLFPRAPIQADIDKAVNEELPKIYAFLDPRLEGRDWLVGDSITLADIAVGGLMIHLYHCGQQVPDSSPNLKAYVERFLALPQIEELIGEEVQMLKAMGYESALAARQPG